MVYPAVSRLQLKPGAAFGLLHLQSSHPASLVCLSASFPPCPSSWLRGFFLRWCRLLPFLPCGLTRRQSVLAASCFCIAAFTVLTRFRHPRCFQQAPLLSFFLHTRRRMLPGIPGSYLSGFKRPYRWLPTLQDWPFEPLWPSSRLVETARTP